MRPSRRSPAGTCRLIILGGIAAVSLIACKPKPGSHCTKDGREVCLDKTQALVCHDAKWETMPCRGATGCVGAGDSASCDNMNAENGDVCNLDGDFACSTDKQSYLQCAKKKWTLVGACRGQNACRVSTKHVDCDSSIAKLDDACLDEGEYSCSDDHRTALVCRAGKFVLGSKCGGPRGCTLKDSPKEKTVDCDDFLSEVGDPCDLAENHACTKDGKTLLVCRSGKYTKEEDCKKKSCKLLGEKVGCL